MELRVLGAIELTHPDTEPVRPQGRLQRLLLALLARRAQTWTSVDTLVEALWPDAADARAEGRLHVHVHRLRARLGADIVQRDAEGYRLDLAPEDVDAWQLDTLVGGALAGRLDDLDPDTMLTTLERGLALWRGQPFAEVEHELITAERHRLTETYLLGQETRYQRRLDRGEHELVLDSLGALAREHPLRERLQALWMTALYRAGEQRAALDVYTETRRRLVDELGIEPGSELRGVHALVLADSDHERSAQHRARPAPFQVPPAPSPLVGRAEPLRLLDQALRTSGRPPGTRLVLVTGPHGIGKSSLAAAWAGGRRHDYPGGHLYLRLTSSTTAADVLEHVLTSLGLEPGQMAAAAAERAAQLRGLLARRRTLLVLDGVRSPDQLAPLLSGRGGTDVLALARAPLAGLSRLAACEISVPPLELDAAVQLLRHGVGDAVDLAPADAERLVEDSERTPWAIGVLAERVASGAGDVGLGGGGAVVAAAYADLDPDTARLVQGLYLLGGRDVDEPTAAAVADLPPATTLPRLERLVRDRLAVRTADGRYRMHDAVRDALVGHVDEAGRADALDRAVTHLTATAPQVPPEEEPGRWQRWLREAATPAVELALELGEAGTDHRRLLADSFAAPLAALGHYRVAERVLRAGLDDHPPAEVDARWRRALGRVVSVLGRQREALDLQAQAEAYLRHAGDAAAHAGLLTEMTAVCALTGDLRRCLRLLDEADAVAGQDEQTRAVVAVVRALVLGQAHRTGEAEQALAALGPRPSLPPERSITWLRARTQVHRRRGEHTQARAVAQEAVGLARETGSHLHLGIALVDLASALRDAGDREALIHYQAALDHAHGAGRDPLAAMTHAALALAWLRWDDPGRAVVHGREALRIAERCECWGFAARACVRLGDAAEALGEPLRAAWYRRSGVAHYRRVDYPVPAAERDRLERLLRTGG